MGSLDPQRCVSNRAELSGEISLGHFRLGKLKGLREGWDFRHSPAYNVLFLGVMHVAIPEAEKTTRKITGTAPAQAGRDYANEEIYAYVAARDTLLVEAEATPTATAVQRVRLANDFVANCLRPPAVPYGSQFLSEPDASRELQRCRDVSARLATLSEG